MKNLLLTTAFALLAGLSQAQQLEQWTQYSLNEYAVNPALAGRDKYFRANAMYRNQWVGITDAPQTYYLSVHGPVWGDRMGIGGSVFNDVIGHVSKSGIQTSYAYHLKLTETYRLSFSLTAGMFQWAVNGSSLGLQEFNDPAISNWNMSKWNPDFGFATRFSTGNFHAGIYIPQIANVRTQLFDDYPDTKNFMSRHYYLNVGYLHTFDEDWAVEGNFLGRYATLDMMDILVRGIFKEMVWLGVNYRMPVITDQAPSALGIMTGYQFENNMSIGYSYDILFGDYIGAASTGSHEVVLGIRFTRANNKPILPAE